MQPMFPFVQSALEILWPRRCELCARPCDRPGRHVCSECLAHIPFYPWRDCCSLCGAPLDIGGGYGDILCGECRGGGKPHFDRAVNAVLFEGDARRMVLDYKYNSHLWLIRDFGDWLEDAVNARLDAPSIDLVLPMPITLFHRYDRGFNQCSYLAEEIARRMQRPCCDAILRRTGKPRRQAGLRRAERFANVAGTFAVRRPDLISGRTMLVVDDVMTTGATLSECAKALKQNGAWRVFALSLARPLADL